MGLARQQGSISWPVPQIMGEMASLFADDMFHIGCDETHVVNQYVHATAAVRVRCAYATCISWPAQFEPRPECRRCTLSNIASFEVSVQKEVIAAGKVPIGWEEILFTTKAALPPTIVNAWARHTAGQVTAAGCVGACAASLCLVSAARAWVTHCRASHGSGTTRWSRTRAHFI